MQKALQESVKARETSPPNPWVGCVIVKHGEIVSEGFTQPYGGAHAEQVALEKAKDQAYGSTVYVTLEPCCCSGKTPACADALIKAGVQKVVIGLLDPDPKVNGKGVEALKAAGIEVEVGLLADEIEQALLPYLYHRRTGRPFILLKAAISMDGKIAAKNGSSIWITGEKARQDVHRIRAQSGAILIGTNTALEDQPRLTVRDIPFEGTQPLRVVLDAKGRIEPIGPLFDSSLAPTLMITTHQCSQERIDEWKSKGCEVQILGHHTTQEGIDLDALMILLGQRGIVQLLVEGGAKLFSSLVREGFVNHLVLYMGACLLGAEGVSLFSGLDFESIDDAIRMQLKQITRFGKDVRMDYTL